MKSREVTTGNGQSPVGPLMAPSARFLDAVNGGTDADLSFYLFFLFFFSCFFFLVFLLFLVLLSG